MRGCTRFVFALQLKYQFNYRFNFVKKLAAGLEGLILDVKVGNGAFIRDPADARKLARTLVDVANGAGCKTAALLTDMEQPLAPVAGNSLEIRNALELLCGINFPRLRSVTGHSEDSF